MQTIVNVIEPDHGTVFDPACGAGGMFDAVEPLHLRSQNQQLRATRDLLLPRLMSGALAV